MHCSENFLVENALLCFEMVHNPGQLILHCIINKILSTLKSRAFIFLYTKCLAVPHCDVRMLKFPFKSTFISCNKALFKSSVSHCSV